MNKKEFDLLLSQLAPTQVGWIVMHPLVWNGYWSVYKRPKIISRFLRFVGRKIRSRRIYWLGLSLYWIDGLKDLPEFKGLNAEVVSEDFFR